MSNYGISNINGNIELTMPLKIMTFTGIANRAQAENSVTEDRIFFFFKLINDLINDTGYLDEKFKNSYKTKNV